ncbi:hypothetical protein DM02DRAFT_402762 [Periconia macrospinosa]|uniref:Uncharacterized protein n=1 Tax=Periconia macrospinosa TaxID=97972 RepID=A0A2V1EBL5_9PLEO|nr:hypothetical protein DM02DRAFT_402762 [Periconia macrospinosa]
MTSKLSRVRILVKDKAELVRKHINYTELQWGRFHKITRDQLLETRRLYPLEQDSWRHVPAQRRTEMWERTNNLLQSEDCPPVPIDVFVWRMHKLLQPGKNRHRDWNNVKVGRPFGWKKPTKKEDEIPDKKQ